MSWATLTGQNMEGTHNAFDTTFWQTAAKQDREQSQRGMRDRFTRADATGIAVYDDPSQGIAFGDVYMNGLKQGNLLKGYAGMNKDQGTEMLARMTLPREVWAKAYEAEAGRPGTLSKGLDAEIQAVREKNTENYAKGLTAADFEDAVAERAASYEESGAAQAANVAAGAAGGALTLGGVGALLGPVGLAVGTGAGALLGGIGAWLNRDEQFQNAATAAEQHRLAREQGLAGVGAMDWISGWAGVAAGNLSPVRNVLRGSYDATQGELGDQRSAYNEMGAPLWFDVVDTGALLVDGIGTFGTKTALRAYTATMAATATGSMGAVVTGVAEGNVGFNPYSGTYENLGWGGMAARTGSAAIDFAQTAVGRGLSRVAGVRGGMADYQGGFRIRTVTGPGGERTREATRLSFSALIPSEAATGLSARMLARRSLRARGGTYTSTDLARETARHIDNLTSGRRGIATMMVNAFGEGTEEFVQAGLDALSVGETPTFHDLMQAYRQGAAMGAGMGLAVARGSRSRSDVWRARSNVARAWRGEEALTDEQWDKLSDQERALEGTPRSEEEQALYELTVERLQREGLKTVSANMTELRAARNAVLKDLQAQARNSQELVDPSRLSVRSNYEWDPQDAVVSLDAAIRDVAARGQMLDRLASGEPIVRGEDGSLGPATGDLLTYAARVRATDQLLGQQLAQLRPAVEQARAAGDLDAVRELVGRANRLLRQWWSAAEDSDEGFGMRRSASVLAARYPLNSAGSFQLLRLQIDPQLTFEGDNQTALMSDEIQPMMGGDYDGDMTNNLLSLMLPADSYRALRHGAGQLTAEGTMMAAKPYLIGDSVRLSDALAAPPSSSAYVAATTARGRLRVALTELLGRTSMDPQDISRLVDRLVGRISTRNIAGGGGRADAISEFTSELASRYSAQMRELAEELDASPWLRINRITEDILREFSDALSLTGDPVVSTTGATELPTLSKSLPYSTPRPLRAASEVATGMMRTGSWDPFRFQTILKYNALREPIVFTEAERNDGLLALTEKFVALNDQLVRSGDEAAFEGTIAHERTLDWLADLAAEYRRDLGAHTIEEAMVLMAAAQVPDVTAVGGQGFRSGGNVTMLQSVLHNVVNGLRREYRDVINLNDQLAQRLASLEELTLADRSEGDTHVRMGGTAFVEVFGNRPIADLLGDAGAPLQSYSVRSLRDKLAELRSDVRAEFIARLKAHEQYSAEVDGQGFRHTPYRVLIDQVVESANMQLAEADGLATGLRARAERQARANFTSLHDSLRAIATAAKAEHNTPEAVRAFLDSRPQLADQVLAIIEPQGLLAGITQEIVDGQVRTRFPEWIYQVLAEPQTARAEMMFLRNTLVFSKAAMSQRNEGLDAARADDRLLALWLDLDARANDTTTSYTTLDRLARDKFVQLLFESGSVDEFLRGLNTDYRFRPERSAPYMAWDRDFSTVTADRFGKGISDVKHGQEAREALRDAAAAAARELQITARTETYLKENAQALDAIRDSRDTGHNPEPWRQFVAWFNTSRDLPHLVSASVWLEQAAHINEVLAGMGVKGQAPSNVEPIAKAIAAQLPTFDSAVGRLLSSTTSGSMGSILTDMTQLARGARTFVLNDGTVVDWQGITPEQALDLLSNKATAGIAARMMGLTAWDFNSDMGATTLTSMIGEGVANFALKAEDELFGTDQLSKFRLLSVLEGKAVAAGGEPIVPVHLAVQMNLREQAVDHIIDARSDERMRMASTILEQTADALLTTARMENLYAGPPENMRFAPATDPETGEDTNVLNLMLREVGREARAASSSFVGRLVHGADPAVKRLMLREVKDWITQTATKAYKDQDARLLTLSDAVKDSYEKVDDWTSPAELLVDRFKDYDNPATQERLMELVRAWGDLDLSVAWARPELQRALDNTRPKVAHRIDGREVELPDLTSDEWHTVARAVIAYTMHTTYGPATTARVQVAKFPELTPQALEAELGFWDPSGVSPVMDMLVPGVMKNPHATPSPLLMELLQLQQELAPQLPTVRPDAAKSAVARLVEPVRTDTEGRRTGVIGGWNALLPSLQHAAIGAIMSSTAPAGIAMAGLNPHRLRFLAATTQMDWSTRPPEDELSSAVVPVGELVESLNTGQELQTPLDIQLAIRQTADGPMARVAHEGRLAQLEGRVVSSVRVVAPDGSEHSLMGDSRFAPGLVLPAQLNIPAGEAGVVSLTTLSESVQMYLTERGVPREQWASFGIALDFYDPRTKPHSSTRDSGDDYSHNAWFDGVAGRTDAAYSQNSLVGFMYFGLDGTVPASYEHTLGAIKKLHSALEQVTTMPESVRRALTLQGVRDASGMLDELTDFVMRQKIDGEALPLTNYNAVRKFLELLYVVRHTTGGTPQVSSLETVMAMQARGEQLENAEVVGLPMPHLLSLMGEADLANEYITAAGVQDYMIDVSGARPYTRFPAQAWGREMFEGLVRIETDAEGNFAGWATADLLAQPELRHQPLPRTSRRHYEGLGRRQRRDFLPFRERDARIAEARSQHQQVNTKWASQRQKVREVLPQLREMNPAGQIVAGVELELRGSAAEAAAYRAGDMSTDVARHDYSTGWLYLHQGARRGYAIDGVLVTPSEIEQHGMSADVIHIVSDTFLSVDGGEQAQIKAALDVLESVTKTGMDIHLPTTMSARPIRNAMRKWLRENNYVEKESSSNEFELVVKEAASQTAAAFNSMLNSAEIRTSDNRVIVDHSDQNRVNENSIYSVNDGIGALESVYGRETVQTARYAGYTPPALRSQQLDVVKILAPLLRKPHGRRYLAQAAQAEPGETTADLNEALDRLADRLQRVAEDGEVGFLPRAGEEFGTGDIIPLVSYNDHGELTGIHLMRHGHLPPEEEALRGAVTAANRELDVQGARLTVDRSKLDADHTTHRGTVVNHKWLGLQGFVVQLRMEVADLGSKVFEVGSGMKWTTTPVPEDLLIPSGIIAAGKPVRGVADLTSPDSKNSDQWWLNNVENIVEFAGFDMMPYLLRTFYGTRGDTTDEMELAGMRNEVTQLLRSFAQEMGDTLPPEALVRRNTTEVEALVGAKLEEAISALHGDEVLLTDDGDAQQRADRTMTRLVLTSLMGGARLDQVLSSPGYLEGARRSWTMNRLLTTMLEQLPRAHPAKAAFVQQVNARMARTHDPRTGDGYTLNPGGRSWTRQVTRPDGSVQRVRDVVLSFPPMRNTDHNDALSEMAEGRRLTSTPSATTMAMAHTTWGARGLLDDTKLGNPAVFDPVSSLHGSPVEIARGLFNMGAKERRFDSRETGELMQNEAEARHLFTRAKPARDALAVEIDTSRWYEDMPKAKQAAAKREFETAFERVRNLAHLRPHQGRYITEMIRAATVRPADVNRTEGEFLTRQEAMAALKLLERNLRAGEYPLHRGGINVVSYSALRAMYEGGYRLRPGDHKGRPLTKWDDWVNVTLSEAFGDDPSMRRYPATTNIIDGLMYEYRKEVPGLPTTVDPAGEHILKKVQTRNGVLVSSPIVRRQMDAASVQDGDLVYDLRDFDTQDYMLDEVPHEVRSLVENRMRQWEDARGMGGRKRQSPAAEARRGAQIRESMARTNVFMRFTQMGYILKTMANVGLHISSYMELAQRSGQERVVSFLSGQNMLGQGFSPEVRQQWRDTRDALANNAEFYRMVYENTNWDPHGQATSGLETRLQGLTTFVSAMYNDPTWGTRGTSMADAFMEAAWDAMNKGDVMITPEQFLDTLATNPSALADINPDAVTHGYARVEYRRNLQDNLIERMRRRAVEGVIGSGVPGMNSLGVILLRFPTMFFRFRSNTLINLMGAQAPMAVLSTLMSDRSKRPGGLLDRLAGRDGGDADITDQARIEDSMDLTRAIIRSGVSHTQLFLLGSMFSALGWGGDDEEERFREKLRRYQRAPVAKDPMALENDWRHAEAWFIDLLPAGAGVPSWVMKMFVSPAMGVARFHETGDFRQVYWGFLDALGSMPLLNLDNVLSSWDLALELQAAAEAESMQDNIEATSRANRLLVTALGTLENMLFESAFASMLYQAGDEWDRDPYALPDRTETGEIRRDTATGEPLRNDALQDIQDPASDRFGEQGYVRPTEPDALLRGMAERRPMLAWALSVIKNDESYWRYNMVPKDRTVRAEELDIDEAGRLVMSIYNNETGAEELTLNGAEAVVRGIQLGTVSLDSPQLQGVFIPRTMRRQLQDRFLEDLTVQYLEMGLSPADAKERAGITYYGQAYGEPEGFGLADILWGNYIPEYQTQRYRQLNTGYVMGPSNRPVATGLKRSLAAAFGVPVMETFHHGPTSNMPVDGLLNSVDATRGINLGLRGLVKVDESWEPMSPEDIAKSVTDSLDEIGKKIDELGDFLDPNGSGWRNFGRGGGYYRSGGRRSYGGGGGGSYWRGGTYNVNFGGQAQRMNAPRRVGANYADDLYSINTSNPIIRRATIRRERFSSTRGRLNQWQ